MQTNGVGDVNLLSGRPSGDRRLRAETQTMKSIETEISTDQVRSLPLTEHDIAGHDTAGLPEDQCARLGEPATFTAPEGPEGTTYQWVRVRRGSLAPMPGETGRTLTIAEATLKDVGFYRCYVTTPAKEELTRPASLILAAPPVGDQGVAALSGNACTIYAATVDSSGSSGSCPGSYVGYVSYTKGATEFGWAPDPGVTPRVATDNERSDTKVKYTGKNIGDYGCGQTSVTLPNQPASPKYRFMIYFSTTVPTSDAYPLTLEGFLP